MTSVIRWAGLTVQLDEPANSNIVIETCTSAMMRIGMNAMDTTDRKKSNGDNVVYRINSATNRYLKVRFNLLSTDGVSSPRISQYAVDYYQDIASPTNPTLPVYRL